MLWRRNEMVHQWKKRRKILHGVSRQCQAFWLVGRMLRWLNKLINQWKIHFPEASRDGDGSDDYKLFIWSTYTMICISESRNNYSVLLAWLTACHMYDILAWAQLTCVNSSLLLWNHDNWALDSIWYETTCLSPLWNHSGASRQLLLLSVYSLTTFLCQWTADVCLQQAISIKNARLHRFSWNYTQCPKKLQYSHSSTCQTCISVGIGQYLQNHQTCLYH